MRANIDADFLTGRTLTCDLGQHTDDEDPGCPHGDNSSFGGDAFMATVQHAGRTWHVSRFIVVDAEHVDGPVDMDLCPTPPEITDWIDDLLTGRQWQRDDGSWTSTAVYDPLYAIGLSYAGVDVADSVRTSGGRHHEAARTMLWKDEPIGMVMPQRPPVQGPDVRLPIPCPPDVLDRYQDLVDVFHLSRWQRCNLAARGIGAVS